VPWLSRWGFASYPFFEDPARNCLNGAFRWRRSASHALEVAT
jgi:hypothetical protein